MTAEFNDTFFNSLQYLSDSLNIKSEDGNEQYMELEPFFDQLTPDDLSLDTLPEEEGSHFEELPSLEDFNPKLSHSDILFNYFKEKRNNDPDGSCMDTQIRLNGVTVRRCNRLLLLAYCTRLSAPLNGLKKHSAILIDMDESMTKLNKKDLEIVLDFIYDGRIKEITSTLETSASRLGCYAIVDILKNNRLSEDDLPSLVDPYHVHRFQNAVEKFKIDNILVDCTIMCGNEFIGDCHKHVLSAFSGAFENIFKVSTNNDNNIFDIKEYFPSIGAYELGTIIDYIYSGALRCIKVCKLEQIYTAANILEVDQLISQIINNYDVRVNLSYDNEAHSDSGTFKIFSSAPNNDYSMYPEDDLSNISDEYTRHRESSLPLNMDNREAYVEIYCEYVKGPQGGRKTGTYGINKSRFRENEDNKLAKNAEEVLTTAQQKLNSVSHYVYRGPKLSNELNNSNDLPLSTDIEMDGRKISLYTTKKNTHSQDIPISELPTLKPNTFNKNTPQQPSSFFNSCLSPSPPSITKSTTPLPMTIPPSDYDVRPYTCQYCSYRAKEKSAIDKHVRCIHTKEAPYICNYCDQRFKVQSNLVRHIRSHTGEKPYACKKCGTAYADKKNMDAHVFREHLKIPPRKCPVKGCKAKFYRVDRLDIHCRKKHGLDCITEYNPL
uniref:BTB domain-containing protein n=1 Tax=Strongyloides papillosus TaxID=174720 RepID=A0A0N5CFU9_STREA